MWRPWAWPNRCPRLDCASHRHDFQLARLARRAGERERGVRLTFGSAARDAVPVDGLAPPALVAVVRRVRLGEALPDGERLLLFDSTSRSPYLQLIA